jgi:hypothetical protein
MLREVQNADAVSQAIVGLVSHSFEKSNRIRRIKFLIPSRLEIDR